MTNETITASPAWTAGEWRVEGDGLGSTVWGACDPDDTTSYGMGIPVARVVQYQEAWARARCPIGPTNMLANARLIAAAPDLYEALEAFLGLNRWQAPRTGGALPTDDEIDEIVAISLGMEAINKARGGVQ